MFDVCSVPNSPFFANTTFDVDLLNSYLEFGKKFEPCGRLSQLTYISTGEYAFDFAVVIFGVRFNSIILAPSMPKC